MVREGLGHPPGGPVRGGRPSQRCWWGRKPLREVWAGSGGLSKNLGGVVSPSIKSGRVERLTRRPKKGHEPFQRSGSGQEALLEGQERLGHPSGGLVAVGTSSRRSGRPLQWSGKGREALPEVLEWSGGPPGGLDVPREITGGVGRPSWSAGGGGRLCQRSGRGLEALPVVREGSGGPPGGPRVVRRPSQRSRKGREAPQ